MPHPFFVPRPARAFLLAGATCLALVATLAPPAQAAEPGARDASAAIVGDFALGDGVEGLIDEQTGALSVGFPVAGGATLEWDSREAGVDRFGIGDGWRWRGIGFISVEGGVRVFPASGGQYEMDASHPTGLAGYEARDVAFVRADDGELLAERADGRVAAQPYRFVLAELGGRRTYFRDDGVPVAMLDPHGNRTDFTWDVDHRLRRMVDELGVVTELTWQPGSVSVQASARADQADAITATVQLGSAGPLAVVDAVARRTALVYDPASELLSRIDGSSGAVTRVTWQWLADGTTAVERVRVTDGGTGQELSGRSWQAPVGAASGWPVVSSSDAAVGAGAGYETAVSDGVSTTRSVYTADRRLTGRALEVTTPSGVVVVQEQHLEYAEGLPGSRPISAELVVTDAAGGARTAANRFEYDDLGRPLGQADEVSSSAVEFDAFGNAKATTTTPVSDDPTVTAPTRYRVERSFDRFGQSVQKTVSAGADQRSGGERELDARGRTVARADQDGNRTTWEYTPDGLLVREVTAYGRITEHEYHPQTRALVRTRAESPIGATVEVAYEHDSSTGAVIAAFDPRDREATEITYEHDAWGNLLSTTYPTGKSVSHRYDEHGRRVLGADGTAYTYNARNQVVEERAADSRTQVAYWADGARRSLLAPGEGAGASTAATEFYWDGADLVNDLHSANTADGDWDAAGYLLGAGRHARTIDDAEPADEVQPQTAYYVSDPLGSATHLLGDGGAAVETYAYTDYGAAREGRSAGAEAFEHGRVAGVGDVARNPVRFAGELTDGSGRQYLRARVYDPPTARFISEDEALQFTRYAYANLNPVRLVDPSGRTPTEAVSWTVIGVGIVAAFVGVGSVLATVATGGALTLGLPSIGVAALGGLADVYSLFVATGQVLSNMRPEWVDDDLEAFFQSDEAVLSEALVGGAAVGAAILFKTGYEALELLPQIERHKVDISRRFSKIADRLGRNPVDHWKVRDRLSAALAGGGEDVFTHWKNFWPEAKPSTSTIIELGPEKELLEVGLRDYAEAERISRGMAIGGVSMDDLLLPMKQDLRTRLAQAFPQHYGETKYLPGATFRTMEGEVIWVDDVLGNGDGWTVDALPPLPHTPHVAPDIVFLGKNGEPGIPAGEY